MAMSDDHMQSVYLRRLAMARAAFALLANSEDHDPILRVMNAEPGCRAAAGLTAGQEASMLAAINSDQFSAQAAADTISDIIATNHGEDGLAAAAADMDLIGTLRRVERLTHFDEGRATDILSGTSIEAKHAAAATAMFQLRAIRRMAGPLLALLDTQASDVAGQSYPEAAE